MQDTKTISRRWFDQNLCLHELDFDSLDIKQSYDLQSFTHKINAWKFLLLNKYQANPGQKVIIEMPSSVEYHACVFAAWEIGLTLVVEWPHAYGPEDLDNHRYTMHGLVDFAIVLSDSDGNLKLQSEWDEKRTRLYVNTIITTHDLDTYLIDQPSLESMDQIILAKEDDLAMVFGSGGTTGTPRKIEVSHRELYLHTQRLSQLLHFEKATSSLHTVNLLHGASGCYFFLPSYMVGTTQYILQRDDDAKKKTAVTQRYQINNVFLYTNNRVVEFFDFIDPVSHEVNVITLFMLTKENVQVMKDKNITRINGLFGDTNIGYGFFVKNIDQSTDIGTYEKNFVGCKVDDFYDFKITDGFLYVKSDIFGFDWKTSKDKFECKDGKFYFHGRGDTYRIGNEWIDLGEIDEMTMKAFGPEGAILLVDYDEQKLYLTIWKDNGVGEQILRSWLKKRYKEVKIDLVTREIKYSEFFIGRKIDRFALKKRMRELLAAHDLKQSIMD